MIKYLLLFLLPFSLYASKILSYNVYDRTDRADVMITFDTPYNGVIKQSRSRSQIILKLEDASIESPKTKKVSSRFLQSIIITPLKNETQIVAAVPTSVKLIASKTSDGYGLRIRFTNKNIAKKTNSFTKAATTSKTDTLSYLPTKKGNDMSRSYYIVIAILIIGILVLFYIKKKSTPLNKQNAPVEQKSPWLFNANTTKVNEQENKPTTSNPKNLKEVAIRFQKQIDGNNSVVMLDFGDESYLVLMGNSNILLDKFHENKPATQQEFDSILQNRHQELEDFLNNNTTSSSYAQKEPLQAYKERAASLLYNE